MVAAFDACKDYLDVSRLGRVVRLGNRPGPIEQILSELPVGTVVAVESTGNYHRSLADAAFERGFEVYVANPRRLFAYRKSEGVRGKTDRLDAQLLETYILEKKDRLHPYRPSGELSESLRELVGRRERLTKAKVQALSSLEGSELLKDQRAALEASLRSAIQAIDAQISALLEGSELAGMLLEVPGFGKVVVGGLLGLLERHEFASADAFVAYLGMDPRPSDSGSRRGRRYVTCEGEATVRGLLYNAALAGTRTKAWRPYYQRQKAKGLASTECLLILARKMARTAWSIHKHHARFLPERLDNQS
jgi:transposase